MGNYAARYAPDEASDSTPPDYEVGELRYQRHSTAMVIGGIVLAASGGTLLTLASWELTIADEDDYCRTNESGVTDCGDNSDEKLAWGMLVAGGIAVGVGIPLIVRGAKRVPVTSAVLLLTPNSVALSASW